MDKGFIEDFLEYSRFTAITGKMGSGKTLFAVALLNKIQEYSRDIKIVSDIILNSIEWEVFKSRNLHDYRNSVIFLDTLEIYKPRFPIEDIMDNFIGFVNDLEENNNHLIITIQDINNLHPDLLDLLDTFIKTYFNHDGKYITGAIIDKNAKLHNNRSPRLLDVGGVDKYYNKYRCTTVGRLF